MTEPMEDTMETTQTFDLSTIFADRTKKEPSKISLTIVCKSDFMGLVDEIAKKNKMTRSETGFRLLNDRLQQLGLTNDDGVPQIEVSPFAPPKRKRAAA